MKTSTVMPTARALRCAMILLGGLSLAGCSLWPFGKRDPLPEDRALPGEEPPAQVIDPDSQRPKVAVKQIKSQDFEVGGYGGVINTEVASALGVYGLRAAYHKSEYFFVEGYYEMASTFGYNELRNLVGADEIEDVDYDGYGFVIGWNAVPGDLYFGPNYTVPFTLYAVAGAGYASFESENFGTYTLGGGIKLLPQDWWSIRLEMRDQIWSLNGTDHNLEATLGLAFFF